MKKINKASNQFPTKNVRYRHDFIIKDGFIIFNFLGIKRKITGFNFIKWLNDNDYLNYFEYFIYKSYGYAKVKVFTNKNLISNFLDKFSHIQTPKIIGIKPKMDNVISHLEEEYKREEIKREEAKREYQKNTMENLKKELIESGELKEEDYINENKLLSYNDYINENWLKKAALAGALATSALSGHSQQKINNFKEYQAKKVLTQTFNSPDDVNKWLKSNLDSNYKWEVGKMTVEGGNELTIKFNADKSTEGHNKIVFTCNKIGVKEEDKSKTHVLEKNPESELLYSGTRFTLRGVDYQWYLIGINTGSSVKYNPNIIKSDTIVNNIKSEKGLIDNRAYDAIYKFETTKGRIIKDKNGKYIATSMENNGRKYDVHQKDKVIKNHIENSIGLDTWYRIPQKFRMQIFSYMFNSDSYEDKKGDRFRWIAGLAQAINSDKFGDRQATMANPKEAIEYIKGLDTKDFEKHYKDYLNVLHSQYASLSTPNGDAYDNAAKELSWFQRPTDLDKYY